MSKSSGKKGIYNKASVRSANQKSILHYAILLSKYLFIIYVDKDYRFSAVDKTRFKCVVLATAPLGTYVLVNVESARQIPCAK